MFKCLFFIFLQMADGPTIVFFDLQTTGYDSPWCHITQLSAICGNKTFNVYTLPRRRIHPAASRLTGFTVYCDQLYLRGRCVGTMPIYHALTSFLNYLSNLDGHGPMLLAAHNAKGFDIPVLNRLLERFSLCLWFQEVVSGYVDTLLLSRNLCPRHLHPGIKYSQKFLVDYCLRESYDAYNAMKNAMKLQKLFNCWSPTSVQIKEFTFPR
ncbi:uncharacterized protein LOC117949393 [Etheostoma cragini]|uniref:uncharacterized protein LOC117949393 n=1 Tax=Etheostoma cragini TaxID=417921 RepID=UPI00155E5AF8|nr:uncharacterized protein LOC117949393 [Etheostoma cragini]